MPTPEEQRELVAKWEKTGKELERIRKEALRDKPYDSLEVVALLDLAKYYDGPPRTTSGLVEMLQYFKKGHPKK